MKSLLTALLGLILMSAVFASNSQAGTGGPTGGVGGGGCNNLGGDLSGPCNNAVVNTVGGLAPRTVVSHTLPVASTTLTCTGSSIAFEDRWVGALSGANVSLALPTPGSCAVGSLETVIPSQDAAHTFAVTGTIQGTPLFTLGTVAGDTITQQYIDLGSTWQLYEGPPYPLQPCTVAQGCTGLATLTSHALYAGNGTSAPTAIGPDSTVGRLLMSQGASADPSFGSNFTFSNPPKLGAITPLLSGTTYVPPTGCTLLLFGICAPGGPGAGTTTGGSTACGSPSGSSGSCGIMSIISPSSNVTYSLGTDAVAGTDGASPTNGTAGGNSTVTYSGATQTFNAGTIPTTGTACNGGTGGCQNAACNSGAVAGSAPAGTNSQITNATGLGFSMIQSQVGVVGSNGGASGSPSKPGTTGNAGGVGGHVTSGGVEDVAPGKGNSAYAWAICLGATAF